jgi:valyl-tRNA synthetase
MSTRAQAHEIIRTWAFYTIVKSLHHFGRVPWRTVDISGWGIAGEGMGKISKSRGGGPASPMEMIDRYSADALRYWAASTGPGKDAVISESKIQMGAKLVTKLWNVARFSQRFLLDYRPPDVLPGLSTADRWILSRIQTTVSRVTAYMRNSEYAVAKSEIESLFWTELADNYLEMAKMRLYDEAHPARAGACYALYRALLDTIKLLALFVPHVTERIYLELFAENEGQPSLHVSSWPEPDARLQNHAWERAGELLVAVATAVRRYKSEHNLPLSTELERLSIASAEPVVYEALQNAREDLKSITRARDIEVQSTSLDLGLEPLSIQDDLELAIARQRG